MNNNSHPAILWIVTGSIAAYKAPEMIRTLMEDGITITCVMTDAAASFVTPMTLSSITKRPVYQDLFSLKDETEMGHIRLSREADLVVVAPATADIVAKLALGLADDLASTLLLATDKPVFVAPAMNVRMWDHPATQRNIKQCEEDGVNIIMPESGILACGEEGMGRMAPPEKIFCAIRETLLPMRKRA